jgi:electron transfer flavoprotein-quinone oxidoreductase
LSKAAQTWFRVDSIDKKTKEDAIVHSFFKARRLKGILGDALGMVRAWR